MITVRAKKLFNGKVSIRDYVVTKAMERFEPIKVVFGKEEMVILPKDLDKGTSDDRVYHSRWGDQKYRLIDFDWLPEKKQLDLV